MSLWTRVLLYPAENIVSSQNFPESGGMSSPMPSVCCRTGAPAVAVWGLCSTPLSTWALLWAKWNKKFFWQVPRPSSLVVQHFYPFSCSFVDFPTYEYHDYNHFCSCRVLKTALPTLPNLPNPPKAWGPSSYILVVVWGGVSWIWWSKMAQWV